MAAVFAGRYELVDPLGEGGGGVVWRVWDHRERRYVAAKVLRDVDATSLLRFMREQSYRIDDPHVLTPFGWAGEDDRVLFTMPLVRGGSVASLVGDYGPLPAPLVGELLGQTVSALAAIHRIGLVHRDVKPANLLLEATGTSQPHLWLADFGVATGVGEPRLTRAAGVVGTTGYVAPETRDGADPHPAADLFATGMSTAEMLTGIRPDTTTDVVALLDEFGVNAALSDLVRDLVAVDPADRPDAELAAERLDAGRQAWSTPAGSDPGDPIEIFDHIPPLPEGWTDTGPAEATLDGGASEADPGPQHPWQRIGPAVQIAAGAMLLLLAVILAVR